jgi:hypothetical protein
MLGVDGALQEFLGHFSMVVVEAVCDRDFSFS